MYEGAVKADKRTKDQDKQQGRFCLLEKSETVKSKAQSLLCQITGWKLELVPCATMFHFILLGIWMMQERLEAFFHTFNNSCLVRHLNFFLPNNATVAFVSLKALTSGKKNICMIRRLRPY